MIENHIISLFYIIFIQSLNPSIPQSMYIILVYDVGEKRVSRMLKLCRKYLSWIQNSVFEGEITEVKLKELQGHARKLMNEEDHSLIIFKSRDQKWLEKQVIGKERASTDNFI
jgi:CRISPR-associated protein Cas2